MTSWWHLRLAVREQKGSLLRTRALSSAEPLLLASRALWLQTSFQNWHCLCIFPHHFFGWRVWREDPLSSFIPSWTVQFFCWLLSEMIPKFWELLPLNFQCLFWHCPLCPWAASSQDCKLGVRAKMWNGVFSADIVPKGEIHSGGVFMAFPGWMRNEWDHQLCSWAWNHKKVVRNLTGLKSSGREGKGEVRSYVLNYWNVGLELSFSLGNLKKGRKIEEGKKEIKNLISFVYTLYNWAILCAWVWDTVFSLPFPSAYLHSDPCVHAHKHTSLKSDFNFRF